MTSINRLKIYVAGPFSAPTMEGILANIDRAIKAGNDVVRKGHHPYIPHLNFYQAAHESSPYGTGLASQNDRRWIDVDAPWVLACDAIYITPSSYEDKDGERIWKSRGAKHEYEQALKTGKLVFMKLDEIPQLPDFEGKN